MTERRRQSTGNGARILVTGASIAAGLGLIGVIDGAAATDASLAPTTEAPVQVIHRIVVVPTTEPDIVLHAAGSSGVRVVQQDTPAPIIRVRPAPAGTGSAQAPQSTQPAPAQTTSSGS